MAGALALPPPSDLPRRLLAFLDERLRTPDDLTGVPSLAAELAAACDALEGGISREEEQLSSLSRAWAARSNQAGEVVRHLKSDLGAFLLRHSPEEIGEASSRRIRRILGAEIPMLAKEVGRIEKIRLYAETTLRLEALMGDLEDAALSLISQNSRIIFSSHGFELSCPIVRSRLASAYQDRNQPILQTMLASDVALYDGMQGITRKQKKLLLAIKTMEDMEKILVAIAKDQLQWTHLSKAVDLRVEKTWAVLRPQALMDHRSILALIGWPPPLSTAILENGGCAEIPNPLVLMKEDKKDIYSHSFLGLLALQVLQANQGRRKRHLLIHQKGQTSPGFTEIGNGLEPEASIWTVDELVYPIASRVEHHFCRWSHQPEFIFALTYRITRDLLEGVDNVLQPLIDEARLVGFSAREAWISAMVKMLTAYLIRRMFPDLSSRYDSESMDHEMIVSWLNLIDLIITFDKKMRALVSSQILFTSSVTEFDGTSTSQQLSMLCLFCDHPEWIELWAQIELKSAFDKLKDKLDKDEAWAISTKQKTEFIYDKNDNLFTFSSIEDCKAPPITDSVIRMAWAMIEKGWALPSMSLKIKFVRSSANNFLHQFSNILSQHCQESESVSIMDNDAIHREASSINAARYCESIMLEWSENVNFLEMYMAENSDEEKKENLSPGCFFANEREAFCKLQTDYLMELISALLLEFDYRCYDYIQSSKRWGEDLDELRVDGILDEQVKSISIEFVEALDMLMDRLQIIKLHLNFKDFLDLWRNVAGGLDHFIFKSILLGNARFSDGGIHQFRTDMLALFLVFKPFCIRPEAFFPCISDSLKLFALCPADAKHVRVALKREERDQDSLRLCGLSHISLDQAEKILSNRK